MGHHCGAPAGRFAVSAEAVRRCLARRFVRMPAIVVLRRGKHRERLCTSDIPCRSMHDSVLTLAVPAFNASPNAPKDNMLEMQHSRSAREVASLGVSPTPSRRGDASSCPKLSPSRKDKLKRACHSGNPGLPRGRHRQAPPAGAASAGYPKALISLGWS